MNKVTYDYVVIGAGLSGSILARKIAEEKKEKVLVIDRRNHIGGNLFDSVDESGIRVQKYGPHTFHTNNEKAYSFFQLYGELIPYRLRCETVIGDISTPSPFNFKTIDQMYETREADELKAHIAKVYGEQPYSTILDLLKCKDEVIRTFAEFLFEKDYRPYTAKQWGIPPEKIDPLVLKRVPIVFSYRDTYFEDKYEVIPKDGYGRWFENILNHSNINVCLGVDALEHLLVDEIKKVILFDGKPVKLIYTGAIDELFSYKFGMLPYRSLYFEYKTYDMKSFQNAAIVAHPQDASYTRITEYTKLPLQDIGEKTVVAYEYPVPYDKNGVKGNEPYYPILTSESQKMYKMYKQYALLFSNLNLCGRLADFQYYNMDQAVVRALKVYEEL